MRNNLDFAQGMQCFFFFFFLFNCSHLQLLSDVLLMVIIQIKQSLLVVFPRLAVLMVSFPLFLGEVTFSSRTFFCPPSPPLPAHGWGFAGAELTLALPCSSPPWPPASSSCPEAATPAKYQGHQQNTRDASGLDCPGGVTRVREAWRFCTLRVGAGFVL